MGGKDLGPARMTRSQAAGMRLREGARGQLVHAPDPSYLTLGVK